MTHTGIEQVLPINGKLYKFSRFTRGILRKWIEWGITQIDDPWPRIIEALDALPLDALDLAEQQARNWKSLDNPALRTLYTSQAGTQKILALLLEKYHWQEDPQPIVQAVPDPHKIIRLASGY